MPDELLLFLETRDRPYCFRCLRQAFPHEAVRERIETLGRDFMLSPTVFDRRELDREKIPYSISYPTGSLLEGIVKLGIDDSGLKHLVVDNRNVPAEKIASLMHVQSLAVRFHRKN